VRRQVSLIPAAFLSQLSDPGSKYSADVLICHSLRVNVLFTLRVACKLHYGYTHEKYPSAYRSLTALDRAVGQTLKHLKRLQRLGLVSREFAESHRTTAEELRAEANRKLTKVLDASKKLRANLAEE
jgi:hypothetical protein